MFIITVAIIFVLFPITTFLHELGHFLTARAFRTEETRIILGLGPRLFRVSNRIIDLDVRTFYFLGGYTIGIQSERLPHYQKALISLNGPLLNAVVGIYTSLYAGSIDFDFTYEQIIALFTMVNLWFAIGNLFPFRLGTKRSDGYVVVVSLFYYVKSTFRKRADL